MEKEQEKTEQEIEQEKIELYAMLTRMKSAAEAGDRQEVKRINKEYSELYTRVFGENYEGIIITYDLARNQCVNLVTEGFTDEKKQEFSREINEHLSTIREHLDLEHLID